MTSQSVHSRDPSCHSWKRPIARIRRNKKVLRSGKFRDRGRGRSKAISTSKIIKITERRKNRRENGRREELIGSNPHSNGDNLARLAVSRADRSAITIKITNGIIIEITKKVLITSICLLGF